PGRRDGQAAALASLAGLVFIGWSLAGDRAPAPAVTAGVPAQPGAREQPFTQARLDGLRAEGRLVFVNMTAAWCVSCLVNERVALTETVRARLEEAKGVYLKGDWTNQNPEITRLLERHGRSGVPLYVLYPGSGEPEVLPQILSESTLLESIERLSRPARRAVLSPSGTRDGPG
ncbi:thioredoxin family protein, partial [Enterovirga sp.]|uniref:thioredoxin family protein n=1 Tax=Enterovirga sp. TaxID=2026350 RepID=UPI0026329800